MKKFIVTFLASLVLATSLAISAGPVSAQAADWEELPEDQQYIPPSLIGFDPGSLVRVVNFGDPLVMGMVGSGMVATVGAGSVLVAAPASTLAVAAATAVGGFALGYHGVSTVCDWLGNGGEGTGWLFDWAGSGSGLCGTYQRRGPGMPVGVERRWDGAAVRSSGIPETESNRVTQLYWQGVADFGDHPDYFTGVLIDGEVTPYFTPVRPDHDTSGASFNHARVRHGGQNWIGCLHRGVVNPADNRWFNENTSFGKTPMFGRWSQCGLNGDGPYAYTDAFPEKPWGEVNNHEASDGIRYVDGVTDDTNGAIAPGDLIAVVPGVEKHCAPAWSTWVACVMPEVFPDNLTDTHVRLWVPANTTVDQRGYRTRFSVRTDCWTGPDHVSYIRRTQNSDWHWESQGIEVQPSGCLTTEIPKEVEVYWEYEKRGQTLRRQGTTIEIDDVPWRADPEIKKCVEVGNDCKPVIVADPLDPDNGECRWGMVVVAMSDCTTAAPKVVPKPKAPPLPEPTDKKVDTETLEPVCTTVWQAGCEPDTDGVPIPPDCIPGTDIGCPGQGGDCLPDGWGWLNPVEWVVKPLKCVLMWFFWDQTAANEMSDMWRNSGGEWSNWLRDSADGIELSAAAGPCMEIEGFEVCTSSWLQWEAPSAVTLFLSAWLTITMSIEILGMFASILSVGA